MKEKWNIYNLKLKYYHIILISMIISPLLIINSNSLNKRRKQEKILKQDEIIFRKLYARKLDSTPDTDDSFISDTNKICEKGSNDLKEYYKTSDTSKLGVKENEDITSENNPEYIDALINLIAGKGDSAENIKNYLMHITPVLVFLVISILFLPGWLVCCFCSCCNCCCCCCCKKPGCKLPFYIITMVIYGLGIAISIYGLSQSNSVFVGLADTECSILKFIGEVLYGETKDTKPKWLGINTLIDKFDGAKNEIPILRENLDGGLAQASEDVNTKKEAFENDMEDQSTNVKNDLTYEEDLTSLNNNNLKKKYKLDIVNSFGTFVKANPSPEIGSLMQRWYLEYKTIKQDIEEQISSTTDSAKELCENPEAESSLSSGVDGIKEIEGPFNDIKNQISNTIIDYSEIIDNYGKLSFKIAFSVLMSINIIIAAFISIKMFFSFLTCQNKCLNCLIKSLIHIFWNILALITFVTLFLGSIFTLIGTAGKDLISVVNFLVSDDNLNSEHTVLLESAPSYLTKCISGDGNIIQDLNIDTKALDNLQDLEDAYEQLGLVKAQADSMLLSKPTYNNYTKNISQRVNYEIDDFSLVSIDTDKKTIKFNEILVDINGKSQYIKWGISCEENSIDCDNSGTKISNTNYCIEPKTCDTITDISGWYSGTIDNDHSDYIKIVNAFISSISKLSSQDSTNVINTALKSLDKKYTEFLLSETETLAIYQRTIGRLVNIFIDVVGEDKDISGIINCKFIGKNVKVILKFLEKALGSNIYTVGICLLVSGCAMCVSISFTILLNIILDSISKNTNNPDEILELGGGRNINNDNGGALSEGVRVINYENY